MKVSLNWLSDFVSLNDIPTDEFAKTIINQSVEIEGLYPMSEAKNLVVGHTVSCEKHPDADKLSVCTVDVGRETLQIVCGAPNVDKNQKVIVALVGAVLPGDFKIKKTALRGVESHGMICSLKELGIDEKYHQETGIHVMDESAPVGADAIEYLGFDDTILELDLTPNRPDLLSMQGIAYDIKAMFDKPLTLKTTEYNKTDKANPLTVKTTTNKCMSYYAQVLDNIEIKPSPQWMKARLIASGIRPINNVVDITNYVMLETNQPLHAFDFDKVGSEEIVVKEAIDNDQFKTLDEQVRSLKTGDILITNGKTPIALGGVMGGFDSEVTKGTQSLILESATFDPISIRKTSKRLDLKSESSLRFEKGLDPKKTKYALDRASELLVKYANATVRREVKSFDHNTYQKPDIRMDLNKINNILGTALTIQAIETILTRLDFEYKVSDTTFIITPPSRRVDINTYQDMIEEIGRIYDYNNLPVSLPKTISKGGLSEYQRFKRNVRHVLSGLNMDETLNYSLIPEKEIFDLTPYKNTAYVKLANPISDKHDTLSVSVLNGLVKTASHNINRKQSSVNIYELGKRYTVSKETEILGLLMYGVYRNKRWQGSKSSDFFTLKGIIEALLDRFNITNATYEKTIISNHHPHQTALIKAGNEVIGHIGKLHPEYAQKHLSADDVFVAELEIEMLYKRADFSPNYEKVLRFPSVSRDIALIVDETVLAGDLIRSIYENSTRVLKDAYVFDVYQGEHLEEGKKSLAIRLRFEDKSGTLKTSTIDEIIKNILEGLKNEHNATLR